MMKIYMYIMWALLQLIAWQPQCICKMYNLYSHKFVINIHNDSVHKQYNLLMYEHIWNCLDITLN
jgi:hypothetical protein